MNKLKTTLEELKATQNLIQEKQIARDKSNAYIKSKLAESRQLLEEMLDEKNQEI